MRGRMTERRKGDVKGRCEGREGACDVRCGEGGM